MTAHPSPPRPRIEVHLEELGQHSWLLALATTLGGTHGSAQYRFVARTSGRPDRRSSHVLEGATFPLMRWQDLDDEHLPNGFADLARERLAEIDADLRAHRWRRCDGVGRHWWSVAYEADEVPVHGPPVRP